MAKIVQDFDRMPAELRKQKRWIPVDDTKKAKLKEWSVPDNQRSLDKVKPPVAFVISAGDTDADEYLVFDFDHVLDEEKNFVTDQASEVCEKIWTDMGPTFVEYSQSGRGLHFFAKPTPGLFSKMSQSSHTLYLDDRTDMPGTERAKLEIFYKSGRYFILTGNKFEGAVDTVASGESVDKALRNVLKQLEAQRETKKPENPPESSRKVAADNSAPSDVERAEAMLQYIDPSELNYGEWLNVGMVLKNIGAPLELWDEWSQQDEARYNQKGQTCEKKWNSFQEEGTLTIATLCKMAKENGYSEKQFLAEWHKKHPARHAVTEELYSIDMGEYLAVQYADDLEEFRSGAELKTGFQNLDEAIQGVGAGLYVIGAIPSLGKTTLMHQMADNMAKAGEYVLYFSLEQEPFELASKSVARESYLLCPESALTEWGVQRGYDDLQRRSLVKRAMERYQEAIGDRLKIIPGIHNVSIEDIAGFVDDFIERSGRRPVVIIDYLQKIQAEGNLTDKQRIDYVTTSLKQLQSRNRIALFVISSFNRANYMQVADYESFKESGDIEYSADAVWALQLQVLNSRDLLAQETGRGGITKSEKRLLVDRAKDEDPRHIELKAIKHRGHKLYRLGFLFHGAHSFFEPDPHYGATSSNVSGAAVTDERPER